MATTPAATGFTPRADIGVIGGSGFYSFFDDAERIRITTPFGDPSDDLVLGTLNGRAVVFLPRHGHDHRFPPHRVNYRANLWAMRSVGVRQVLAPCAVGSLRRELTPGTVVVPDQIVDRTWGRPHTVYDATGPVAHIPFAQPYCPRGREAVLRASAERGAPAVDGGTLVVINGPRFSTEAESRWHQQAGWSLVGMTAMPEASIARELAMCFTTIAMVTDHDAGVDDSGTDDAVEFGSLGHVTHDEVLRVFAANMPLLKERLRAAVAALPDPEPDDVATCSCRRALDGITLPFPLP